MVSRGFAFSHGLFWRKRCGAISRTLGDTPKMLQRKCRVHILAAHDQTCYLPWLVRPWTTHTCSRSSSTTNQWARLLSEHAVARKLHPLNYKRFAALGERLVIYSATTCRVFISCTCSFFFRHSWQQSNCHIVESIIFKPCQSTEHTST